MKQKWSCNTDVEPEKLQNLYKEYLLRRETSQTVGLGAGKGTLEKDLSAMIIELKDDLQFLQAGEKKAREIYNKNVDKVKVSLDSLFTLGWDTEGYVQLLKQRESFEKSLKILK